MLSVSLGGEGRLLVRGGLDGTVRLWEPRGGRLLATLQGHAGGAWGVTLSTGNRLLASLDLP